MKELDSSREEFIKKKKQALTKLNSFRENFEKKEKAITGDLEETGRIWRKVGEKFKWWQSLP